MIPIYSYSKCDFVFMQHVQSEPAFHWLAHNINSLHAGKVCMLFWHLLIFLFKINVFKYSFSKTIRVLNSLDTDNVHHFVGSDLCPNCLQRFMRGSRMFSEGVQL